MTALNPSISWRNIDSAVDTSFYKTVLVVGQSNTASEGIYKNLELLTEAQINTNFGANSHLAACLRDVRTLMADSIVKPKIMAVSYEDKFDAVNRIVTATVTGTATEDRTLNIKLNSLNPDRMMTQEAVILALRNTKGAYCGKYARNGVEFGSPRNANMGINPILADAFTNDVIVEVEITRGMTASQAAAAINTAVNAKTTAIYTSTVLLEVVTLTADHKGAIGNMFAVECVSSTIAAGLAIALEEETAGSGVVDATAILAITDENSIPLSELNFDFMVIPYGYSVTALVADAKAKWDNVLDYNNQCLNYEIMRSVALDLSSATAINSLASAESINEAGIVKQILISKLDGLRIIGVNDKATRDLIESKQFTPLQREKDGRISIGNAYTLSNSISFRTLRNVITIGLVREVHIEKFFAPDFTERNYVDGKSVNSYSYNRDEIIARFKYFRDILDGTVINNDTYTNDYAGVLENSPRAREKFDELLQIMVSFDKTNDQLIVPLNNTLTHPIKSIFVLSYYS